MLYIDLPKLKSIEMSHSSMIGHTRGSSLIMKSNHSIFDLMYRSYESHNNYIRKELLEECK